jgi:hypothetical protein
MFDTDFCKGLSSRRRASIPSIVVDICAVFSKAMLRERESDGENGRRVRNSVLRECDEFLDRLRASRRTMRHADISYEPCAFYRLSLPLSRWSAHSRRSALVPCFRRLCSFVLVNAEIAKNPKMLLTERTKHSLTFGVCGQTVFWK